jgi:type III restriction enzyme
MHYNAPSNELWVQHLHTLKVEIIGLGKSGVQETRPEDYIVSGLVDFDDVSYDNHADLLYNLSGQTVRHFRGYLSEEDTIKVLRMHQKEIARFIYTQMQQHYWENATDYEVRISRGFTELKDSAYSADDGPPTNYRQPPADKSAIPRYVYTGFGRCLYPYVKFQSDTERKMATIIERESLKWFRPAKGQFQIFYRMGIDHCEYQPDFVAETDACIYMIETKARNDLAAPEVIEKKNVGVKWCKNASDHAKTYNGKPWKYLLVPHDVVAENQSMEFFARGFGAG